MNHPFAATRAKIKATGYKSLTDWEKWEWHADVYGFRRVVLGVAVTERTSLCDTDGKWFDVERAEIAERYYLDKHRRSGPARGAA